MTFKNYCKIKDFMNESLGLDLDAKLINAFAERIYEYFNDEAFLNLKWKQNYLKGHLTEDEEKDLSIIRTYLQRKLDSVPNASSIETIYDLCSKIERVGKEDFNQMSDLIKEIYSAFYGKIQFDDNLKAIASFHENGNATKFYCALNIGVLLGLKTKLESYADDLLNPKSVEELNPNVLINNNNFNTQNTSVTIDVKAEVESAYKKAEEACLSIEEEELLKERIKELKELLLSEEKKNKKWMRFKEILGGLANFSLKAAEILGPLMIAAWPK